MWMYSKCLRRLVLACNVWLFNMLLCLCVSVFDWQEWPWTLKRRRSSVLCGALHWVHQSLAPCRFVHSLNVMLLFLSLLNPNVTSLHESLPRVSVAWSHLKQLLVLHSSGSGPGFNRSSTIACVVLVSHPGCVSGAACFRVASEVAVKCLYFAPLPWRADLVSQNTHLLQCIQKLTLFHCDKNVQIFLKAHLYPVQQFYWLADRNPNLKNLALTQLKHWTK